MHAPDGFYSNNLSLVMDLVCTGVLAYSLKKIWKKITTDEILLASAVGAFCFTVEMAKFDVTPGSSCHFMGGVLAAIVLGPYLAMLVMTLIHIIQVFVFQDGGIMAFGPNLLTIGIVSTFVGYYLYSLLKELVIEPYGSYISAFLSAWLTLLITSLTVCGMLSVCGTAPFSATISPMLGPHVEVGMAEGLLTALLLIGIHTFTFGTDGQKKVSSPPSRRIAFILLGTALLISLIISPFASRTVEGLNKIASDRIHHFSDRIIILYRAPIPDYHLPGIENPELSKLLGGTFGTVAIFVLCFLICLVIKERGSFENS